MLWKTDWRGTEALRTGGTAELCNLHDSAVCFTVLFEHVSDFFHLFWILGVSSSEKILYFSHRQKGFLMVKGGECI